MPNKLINFIYTNIFILGIFSFTIAIVSCPTDNSSTQSTLSENGSKDTTTALSYVDITGPINTQITTVPPTWTNPNISAEYTYTINPSLPTGLNMASDTGIISGTPTVEHPATSHTITATDNSDTTRTYTDEITITIQTQ